eukprot:gnl/TRDRNA2_/TRDRNA2_125731_c0_seq3.p1 gnl/TRDRNA2_/TRDRNA2_125731_c0~~gnl/TRDRNA2_/TRDRNA2_125731_c0_seq3.p1  ORF type:complete len:151 (+),score=4.88 gnl/TRDRNA2_/TRDRNA2_125731_c0_seq3:112-564(+)
MLSTSCDLAEPLFFLHSSRCGRKLRVHVCLIVGCSVSILSLLRRLMRGVSKQHLGVPENLLQLNNVLRYECGVLTIWNSTSGIGWIQPKKGGAPLFTQLYNMAFGHMNLTEGENVTFLRRFNDVWSREEPASIRRQTYRAVAVNARLGTR